MFKGVQIASFLVLRFVVWFAVSSFFNVYTQQQNFNAAAVISRFWRHSFFVGISFLKETPTDESIYM